MIFLLGAPSSCVEAIISTQTGCLSAYRVNGVDLLVNQQSQTNLPSRFQLHRAPTAIDHKGYLSAWNAAGLDKDMHHVANGSSTSPSPEEGHDVLGHTDLRLVQVDRIYLHQRDDMQTSANSEHPCGEGIMCTWEMASDSIDR
jgi:hypothetical protein